MNLNLFKNIKTIQISILSITLFSLFNLAQAADTADLSNTSAGFPACIPVINSKNLDNSTFWYNQSAEKKAIYKEIYLMADGYIQYWVKQNHPKPDSWGIVLDIDETTLDNAWFSAECRNDLSNEDNFEHYVSIPAESKALPGVVHLTHLVHSLGGYVSFVSNRDGSYSDKSGSVLISTVNDLKAQDVYFDQVVLSNYKNNKTPSDKNPRFQAVINNHYDKNLMVWTNTLPAHQVIAYFGDNIQDFPKLTQAKTHNLNWDNAAFSLFGRGYFIFPNPMYGSWEGIK